MKYHKLKIQPKYLKALQKGLKTAEIRFNDRQYTVQDRIIFEQDRTATEYEITFIHTGIGMKDGYVVLYLKAI
jgi:ASC-1-like (ASCH) protein